MEGVEVINIIKKNSARSAILALGDQAIASANNMLTGVIIGRACTKEEFGLYALGFTIILFIMGFQSALIISPYTVYASRFKGMRLSLFNGSTILHQFSLSIIAIFSLIIGYIIVSLGLGPDGLDKILRSLIVAVAFVMLREYVRHVNLSQFRMATAIVIDTTVAVLQIFGLLILYRYNLLTASSAYFIIGAATCIVSAIWIVLNYPNFMIHKVDALNDLKRNWSFGKWTLGSILAFFFSTQLSQWFVLGYHGISDTATFAACMAVVGFANPFITGMCNFLRPKTAYAFAHGGKEELYRVVKAGIVVFAIVMGLFVAIMAVYGSQLIEIIYGSKYAGTGTIVSILALGMFSVSVGAPFDYGLWALEHTDALFYICLVEACFSLTLGVYFIKRFGPIGAAWSFFIGKTSVTIAYYFLFKLLFEKHNKVISEEDRTELFRQL